MHKIAELNEQQQQMGHMQCRCSVNVMDPAQGSNTACPVYTACLRQHACPLLGYGFCHLINCCLWAGGWHSCAQDSARVEKERQRASSRVQQLQTELSSMRTQQDGLRKRLQDRLLVQEKAAAAKAREMSALRRAGELDSTPASQSISELGHAHGILQPLCAPGAELASAWQAGTVETPLRLCRQIALAMPTNPSSVCLQ